MSVPRASTPREGAGEPPSASARPVAGDAIFVAPLYSRLDAQLWRVVLVGAVASFVLGLLVVVWPSATLDVVAVIVGIQVLVAGIIRLADGIRPGRAEGGMRVAYVIVGLLGIVVGLYFLRHVSITVTLVAFLLGIFWVLHGIVDLVVAASMAPLPGRGVRVATGLLSLAAGLIVMFEPRGSLTFLLVVAGIWLMLYGVLLAVWALQARKVLAAG